MIDAHRIIRNQDRATVFWHAHESHFSSHPDNTPAGPVESVAHDLAIPRGDLMSCILAQHRANFELWHQEDLARDASATAENIATVKHEIDRLNQNRNDLVEQIDQALLCSLPAQAAHAPLNSETPGLIVDRLSILALKIYHTREEAERETATENHRSRNLNRLAILEEQRSDLAGCLDTLWHQVIAGQRRFKLYLQMKMYNDPQLNPVLYGRHNTHKGC